MMTLISFDGMSRAKPIADAAKITSDAFGHCLAKVIRENLVQLRTYVRYKP